MLKNIPKYVVKKYFQIVLLMSKLFLNFYYATFKQWLQEVKVLIRIFHSLDWFQIFIHNVFTITFYNIFIYLFIILNPKFKKLNNDYDCFWYMLIWLHPNMKQQTHYDIL
jgi:hypothetical protein